MKRILAVMMTTLLIISCMPAMAFAQPPEIPSGTPAEGEEMPEGSSPGSVDPEREELLRKIDGKIRDLTLGMKKLVTNKDLLDRYDKLSKAVEEYKPVLDEFAEQLRNEKGPEDDPEGTKDIDYYGRMTDDYINNLNGILVDFQQDDKTRAAVSKLKDELTELRELIDKYDLDDKETYQNKISELLDKIQIAETNLDIAAYEDIAKDALSSIITDAQAIAAEISANGISADSLLRSAQATAAYAKASELLQKAAALNIDLSKLNVKVDLASTLSTLSALKDKAGTLINKITDKMSGADRTKHENAIKVVGSRPTLSSVKAKKGGKLAVTFKGIKGAEVTRYQINYKVGKKSKTVTVKKSTTSAKTVKYTLKKLKKGKKYTVKVRAVYETEIKGKKYTVTSSWSAAKKVKTKAK